MPGVVTHWERALGQPTSPLGESMQMAHVLLTVSQTGVGAMQPRVPELGLVSHPPQRPAREPVVMHAGVLRSLAEHALSAAETGVIMPHATQVLLVGEHSGAVALVHCALLEHATHTPAAVSQWGVPVWLAHCASMVQPVPQRLVLVLQIGAEACVHCASVLHSPHLFFDVQTGPAPNRQSTVCEAGRHSTQVLLAGSNLCRPQSDAERARQVPSLEQTGVAGVPLQSVLVLHCTQEPDASEQCEASVTPAHSAATVQALQVKPLLPCLQMGVPGEAQWFAPGG